MNTYGYEPTLRVVIVLITVQNFRFHTAKNVMMTSS